MFKLISWLMQAAVFCSIGIAYATWGKWGNTTVSERLRSFAPGIDFGSVSDDASKNAKEWIAESQDDLMQRTEPLKHEIDAQAKDAERFKEVDQKKLKDLVKDLRAGRKGPLANSVSGKNTETGEDANEGDELSQAEIERDADSAHAESRLQAVKDKIRGWITSGQLRPEKNSRRGKRDAEGESHDPSEPVYFE